MKNSDRIYNMDEPIDMVRYVARERFAWPGGYELVLHLGNGGSLCSNCVRAIYKDLIHSQKTQYAPELAMAVECGAEFDPNQIYCENCAKDLSSYAEVG
jgi:hypothetical protein